MWFCVVLVACKVEEETGESYCTVAEDASASAIQTISRRHSGSSLRWPLGCRRRRAAADGRSGRQLSELRPGCSNSLSMGEGWARASRGKAAVTASDLHECLTPVPKAFA